MRALPHRDVPLRRREDDRPAGRVAAPNLLEASCLGYHPCGTAGDEGGLASRQRFGGVLIVLREATTPA